MSSRQQITDRIDAVTRIPTTHRAEVLPPPRSVKVSLTENCNYGCRFCTQSINGLEGEMDRALFSRIIREAHDFGVQELGVFYLGESFLCKWLPDAIREAKQVGYEYVFLTTNGSAAAPARVRACMEAGLDSLKFSVNFYSGIQLPQVARVSPQYWRRSLDNLKYARAIRDEGKFKCGVYASSIRLDDAQLPMMESVVREILPFVDQHYWLPLYGMAGASKANGFHPRPGNPGRIGALRAPIPCWSVFTEGHVTKDGLLSACCFGNGASTDLAMADLRQVDFMTGWNSLAYQRLRRAHLSGDISGTGCESCVSHAQSAVG